MIKQEALDAFIPLTDQWEGRCSYLYTDRYGLVTTARGHLCDEGLRREHVGDPLGKNTGPTPALSLGWHVSGGDASLADAEAIRAAWWRVKNSWPACQSVHCEMLTGIRLYLSDIDRITDQKLAEMWAVLASRFANLETAPAPAQLGVVSMSWAMGPCFAFPKFEAAFLAEDWTTCALECRMSNGSPARNDANVRLFRGAAAGLSVAAALATASVVA